MKYLTALLSGIASVIALSFLVTPVINELYIRVRDIEAGPDGETELFQVLLYVQWPTFFVVGLVVGYILHTKFLTKRSKPTPKGGAV